MQLFAAAAAAGDARKQGSPRADVAEVGGAGGGRSKVRFTAALGRVSLTLADAAVCGFLVQEEAEVSGAVRGGRAG